MENKNLLKRVASAPFRAIEKLKVIPKLLETPQNNGGIINIHRIDTDNIGDFYCAPHHYYDEIKNPIDIFDFKRGDNTTNELWIQEISNNALIIGGGGLLNRKSFEKPMKAFEELAKNGKKTVLWGVGHNSKKITDFNNTTSYNVDVTNFGLAGTRDYNLPGVYLPCVSCKHPIFDKIYTEKYEIGFVFHKNTVKDEDFIIRFKDYPTTSNTTNLEELISFIGKCETIITDSYHAMYWSMLLKKKVAVVPNSSKFFDFKYSPVFTTFDDCLKDSKKAIRFEGVLEESRQLNDAFFKNVKEYLEL